MNGHVILSHGMDSGPQASKVTALAKVADQLGFRTTRPDYRDLDACHGLNGVEFRLERLKREIQPGDRLILAGSSMGAFISGLASLEVPCMGLFLLALPLAIPNFQRPFAAADIPTVIVHGWQDELIPEQQVIAYARSQKTSLMMINDGHRLSTQVDFVAKQFEIFLANFL